MGVWFSQLWPEKPNPSLVEIEARQRAEAVAEEARRNVEIAQANQEAQQKLMEAQQAAHTRAHDEMMAKFQAEQAARETAQAQAHEEIMAMLRAERVANEARLMAETTAHAANEEAMQRVAEAEKERERTVAMQEQIQKDAQAAHEHAKKLKEAAKEEKRKTDAEREAANADEAEGKLTKGIQPLVTPTREDVCAFKLLAEYREDLFHIAVAGTAGGGKSSLINAFRGLRNKDAGSAATGVTETTLAMARYGSPNAEYPYVWYDIPGAGTLKIPDWQYFNAQGLYVFDCIIVLFDNRFTMTDIAILTNCRRFKIPTTSVIMKDMGYDSDDDESEDQKKKLYQDARQQFIRQTRQSVKDNLESANMPDQRVYIVSNEPMLGVVKEKRPKKIYRRD
ncbi:interferon-inducible GTPase-domain-containing protein [Suillus spraguei]|nr:interferon-inducible GTPase-domain-containing protein [Suillus spraguei]